MAKNENVEKKNLLKANAYSVLTVILTIGLIFLAVFAILGVPYFTYVISGSITSATPIMFEDMMEFSYFIPFSKILADKPVASEVLGPEMFLLYKNVLGSGTGLPQWLRYVLVVSIIVGSIMSLVALFGGLIMLCCTISAFVKGKNKCLRRATRGYGIIVMLTTLPVLVMNVMFALVKEVSINTLVPFLLFLVGLIVELANGYVYRHYLKDAEIVEELPIAPVSQSQDEVEQSFIETYNEIRKEETGAFTKQPEISECDCSCCSGCDDSFESKAEEPTVTEDVDDEIKEEPKVEEKVVKDTGDVKVVVVNNDKNVDQHPTVNEAPTKRIIRVVGLPLNLTELGDHRFSKNGQLQVARIPSNITEMGVGCFANCYNLEEVFIPISIKKICANALFACQKLRKITYEGTIAQFRNIERQTNWLTSAGTNIIQCADGDILIQ